MEMVTFPRRQSEVFGNCTARNTESVNFRNVNYAFFAHPLVPLLEIKPSDGVGEERTTLENYKLSSLSTTHRS